MRLWSFHPQYLDSKGLVALWRESLLAQACLDGKTKGYNNHPQLDRFKQSSHPIRAISTYLHSVANEASKRNYNFNSSKILEVAYPDKLTVTKGQLYYEWAHFIKKIQVRDQLLYKQYEGVKQISQHPLFKLLEGDIENWEKI